jgi:4'-phosphopantetheinyl transferase
VGIRAILFAAVIEGVHIWRAALDENGWPGPERLPAPERRRFEAFLRPDAARRWAASRWALRRVLAVYLGADPVAIELGSGKQGKPRLARADGLEFNLSHSGGIALVAVAERPVGVDVELIRPGRNLRALAERALPARDVDAVNAATEIERPAIFYAAWARHEARLKCAGAGLGGSPAAAPIAVEGLECGPGHAAAVAVAGTEIGPVTCRSL